MNIFILKHPNSKFSGNIYGVNFDNGIGSTSSQRDAEFCIQKKGCEDITSKYDLKQTDPKNPAAVNYIPKGKKKKEKEEASTKKGK